MPMWRNDGKKSAPESHITARFPTKTLDPPYDPVYFAMQSKWVRNEGSRESARGHQRDSQSDGPRDGVPRLWTCDAGRDRGACTLGGGRPSALARSFRRPCRPLRRALGYDRRGLRDSHRPGHDLALVAHSFGARAGDDLVGGRAVPTCRRRRWPADSGIAGVRAAESLDAAWALADRLQPRRIRVLPVSSTRDFRRRHLVLGRGARMFGVRPGRARALAVGDGRALWRGTAAGRRNPATKRRRRRRCTALKACNGARAASPTRSEEHTSELQSHS